MRRQPPTPTLFPYTTLFRSPYYPEEQTTTSSTSEIERVKQAHEHELMAIDGVEGVGISKNRIGADAILNSFQDRKSTRLNSSHEWISYAVFCLKKKNKK